MIEGKDERKPFKQHTEYFAYPENHSYYFKMDILFRGNLHAVLVLIENIVSVWEMI